MKALLLLIGSLSLPSIVLAQAADILATPASLLRYVDTSDGVSRAEANDIAKAYFLRHVGCGAYSGISELPGSWEVEGNFGYSGEPIRGFLIDKQIGAIVSPVGPSYARPDDMLGPDNSFRGKPLRGFP